MPNVPTGHGDWLSLRLERRGERIQMWVNDIKGPSVTDNTYGAGRAGIAGFSQYHVRGLKIDGKQVDGGPWPEGDKRGRPWFHIESDLGLGDIQASTALCKTDDEILLSLNINRDDSSHSPAGWQTIIASL